MQVKEQKYSECKLCVLKGVLLLVAGSLLLLTRKLDFPEAAGFVAVLVGACMVLLGNGFVLYGLLIFSDSRGKAEGPETPEEAEGSDCNDE